MDPDRSTLADEIADAILTGAPIEWPRIDKADPDSDDSRLIAQLKVLSRIAAAYRQLPLTFELVPEASHVSPPLVEDPTRSLPLDGRTFGPLQIRGKIGEGSFGDVFRAWDTRLEREVALKLLRVRPRHAIPADTAVTVGNPATVLAEARQLARVRHPNVVTIHGADYLEGHVGLWMELVEGATLYTFVPEQHPLPIDQVRAIAVDLAGAVAAVHAKGVIHGDITPKNVMRESTGRIVLMDFGAGRDQRDDRDEEPSIGTPVCMAPELLAGRAATVQSDLYSLGVVVYFAATGSFPVTGRSLQELRAAHADGAMIPLRRARPDIQADLAAIVGSLLMADPAKRPARAEQVHAALVGDGLASARRSGGRADGTEAAHPLPRTSRFPSVVARGIAALAVALTAGAIAWFGTTRPEGAMTSVLRSGGTAGTGTSTPNAGRYSLSPGHLLFPVAGLNALQEVDPATHTIIQTIPLPDGYSYSNPPMQLTVLIRDADRAIFTNARDRSGRPVLLVLSERGELKYAQTVPSSLPGPRQYLQQLQFDVDDPTQSRVLGGIPLTPRVIALNPFTGSSTLRLTKSGANYIGLQTDRRGAVYIGNWATGQVVRFVSEGSRAELTQESIFADLMQDTGSTASNAIAVDEDVVYISQCDSQRVLKYVPNIAGGPTTGTLSAILSDPGFTHPCSVFVEPATGRLYVGNQDTSTVVIFERDGTRVGSISLGGRHVGVPSVIPG